MTSPASSPASHRQRVILFLGLWLDPPQDRFVPRFAHLPEQTHAHGFELVLEHRVDLRPDHWRAAPPAGIILTGSRQNLGQTVAGSGCEVVLDLLDALPRVPVLGLCFGHQLLALGAGGRLGPLPARRDDRNWPITFLEPHPLFADLASPCPLAENHQMRVTDPGPDYRVIASSADGIEAIAHRALPRLGVQFHPEYWPEQGVPFGRSVFENWLRLVAGPGVSASSRL